MSLDARKIRLIMELRQAGITDTRVLAAIERVPRERFLHAPFQDRAYENEALPIGHGQTISQPLVVAQMTQALEPNDRMKVLEIGTGSGYQAAVLARLFRRVYTLERHRPLMKEAEERFHALRLHNVTTLIADGSKGWAEQAPFDRILVTAAAERVPETVAAQLGDGGLLVLPLADPADARRQHIVRVRRDGDELVTEHLGAVRFVPLIAGLLPEDEAWRAVKER